MLICSKPSQTLLNGLITTTTVAQSRLLLQAWFSAQGLTLVQQVVA
jgi:hypothetical protein